MSIFKKSSAMPIARTTVAFPSDFEETSPGLPDKPYAGVGANNAVMELEKLLERYGKKAEDNPYWEGFRDGIEVALDMLR